MAVSHTLSFAQSGGSTTLSDSVTVTGESATESNIAVAGSTTNQLEAIAFPYATLVELYIKSDVALTIKTNSSGSPDDTITIAAGKPLVWYSGCGLASPITANVTSLYVTNATSGAANLYIRTLVS